MVIDAIERMVLGHYAIEPAGIRGPRRHRRLAICRAVLFQEGER